MKGYAVYGGGQSSWHHLQRKSNCVYIINNKIPINCYAHRQSRGLQGKAKVIKILRATNNARAHLIS